MRAPCCEKMGMKKGPWTPEEDQILISYIQKYGHGNWRALPKQAGLLRCGKSCRLRWTNYLRPDIKRGNFSQEEEETIFKLHQILGNRWSAIAARLPGRTDNEIKNFWNTHLKKRLHQNLADYSTDESPICNTRKAGPLNLSNRLIFQTLAYAPISTQNYLLENVLSSDSPVITTTQPFNHTNASSHVPEMLNWKHIAKNMNGQYNSTMSPCRVDSCHNNGDMDFWYNLFVKAEESQK